MNLGEFLSPEAGQRRTRALHEFINEDVAHFVPPNLREVLGLAAEMNPVNDIYQAGGDLRDGDYIGAATNTAAAALPLAGAVAARPLASGLAQTGDDASRAIVDALTMYQAGGRQAAGDFIADESGALRLYHGSPHDFDRFSMDAIGTGEGAQAYGHGLYFAESEDVARNYRDRLARPYYQTTEGFNLADQYGPDVEDIFQRSGGDPDDLRETAKRLRNIVDENLREGGFKDISEIPPVSFQGDWSSTVLDFDDRAKRLERLLASGEVKEVNPGRMYEVNVNANPEDFLDWDAPLSEQPEVARRLGYASPDEILTMKKDVHRGLSDLAPSGDLAPFFDNPTPEFERLREIDRQARGLRDWTNLQGSDVGFRQFQDPVHSRLNVREAVDRGIPGIRYRDAGSRGLDGAEGTRNYVIFDENLIEIVRKYGIAGAAAMLGMSASDVEAQMGQRDNMSGLLGMPTESALRDYLNQ